MPIPDYQRIMFPLLKLSSDDKEHSSKESVEELSKIFNLTGKEKEEKYDTKNVTIFYDRVHWALSYLKNAGLIEGTKRGSFKITKKGKDVLKKGITEIDRNYLKQFPEFNEFLNRSKINNESSIVDSLSAQIKVTQEVNEEN